MKTNIKFLLLTAGLLAAPLACQQTYSLQPSSAVVLPTPAPCSGAVSFGRFSTLWDYSHGANYIEASLYTLSDSAHLTSINVYCRYAGAIRAGIYGDGIGSPGALIAQTPSVSALPGWFSIPLSPSVALAPGNYWLAVISSTTGLIVSQSGVGNKIYQYQTYGALPNFLTSPTTGNFSILINASYTCP